MSARYTDITNCCMVHFLVNRDVKKEIKLKAYEMDITMSELIRNLVIDYLKKSKTNTNKGV